MVGTTMIRNGAGVSLDATRKGLRTRTRRWLGQEPRGTQRQFPLAEDMAAKICMGDFVSTDASGCLTVLSENGRFAGICTGVGEVSGRAMGSVRIGVIWEHIYDLTSYAERGCRVFADPHSQALNLSSGVPVGRLSNVEEFAGGLRGHVCLETGSPTKSIGTELKEIKPRKENT